MMPEWERKLTLPIDIIKGVFDDLDQMGGLSQVKLVGGGEPFLHPHILKIVEYIKHKDKEVEIDINTNFSLVDERVAERLNRPVCTIRWRSNLTLEYSLACSKP